MSRIKATRVSSEPKPRGSAWLTHAFTRRRTTLGAILLGGLCAATAQADEPASIEPPATTDTPAADATPPAGPSAPLAMAVPDAPGAPSGATMDATPTIAATAPAPTPPPTPPPPPYSVPWQLRPVSVANVLRSDTAIAFYKNAAGESGSTEATMLLASYKITPELAPLVRLGFVNNAAPGAAPDGKSFINPLLGLTYSKKLSGPFRFGGFAATTLPIGMAGGDMADAGNSGANGAGIPARSAMDNAMFVTNYITPIVGAGIAYIANGLTIQAEATILQLIRVRGENAGNSTDAARTNSTAGIHIGYYVIPQVSLGGEFRYQRWLSTPTRLTMGTKTDIPDFAKDTITVAIGPRFHFKAAGLAFKPGISYGRGLDKPMTDSSYNIVQIDIPVVF